MYDFSGVFIIYLILLSGPSVFIVLMLIIFFISIARFTGVFYRSKVKKLTLYNNYKSGFKFMNKTENYGIALLNIFISVVRADNKVYNVEVDLVHGFLYNFFSQKKKESRLVSYQDIFASKEVDFIVSGMDLFDEIYKKGEEIEAACKWLKDNISIEEKKYIIWFLFRLSVVNKEVAHSELSTIGNISMKIDFPDVDFLEIKRIFVKERAHFSSYLNGLTKINSAYEILGIRSNATDKEIKNAFRKLAKLYHPDKFATDTHENRQKAKSRFQEISNAYDILEKEKNKMIKNH